MRALLALLLALPAAGCLASSVVDQSARAVAAEEGLQEWRPALRSEVPGLYSSLSIDGPAAAVLREVHYWFGADGRFTGAALLVVPQPSFQVLDGEWQLDEGSLVLGEGAAPARAEVSGDLLRLSGEEGTVVLRRREER